MVRCLNLLVLKLEDDDDVTLQNESCEVETASDDEFIDNTEYNEIVENYYVFDNVPREYNDGTGDTFSGFDFSQEPSNYCSDDEICDEVIEFKKEFNKNFEKSSRR